jgi:membrane-associated phospholipid phosphatase
MINFGKVLSFLPSFVYHFPLFVDHPFLLYSYLDILVRNTWNMRRILTILIVVSMITTTAAAQTEPAAGTWKTWFISSGRDYRLNAPTASKNEIAEVLAAQKNLDAAGIRQIDHWNAGPPGYRWQDLMAGIWMTDTGTIGPLSYMLLNVAIYDATIAAWDTKYAFKRQRPYAADSRIKVYGIKPESPSYPCEHSVAAGAAVAIFSHFYPRLADSVKNMAQRQMTSRVAAGLAFPEDTRAGFELGKRIAEKEIAHTKDFTPKNRWDGTMPQGPAYYRGKFAMWPTAGTSKTVVLTSSSQFRPPPPPDFAKDMAELKSFKQTFSSRSNAFYYGGSQNSAEDVMDKKIFEHNYHLNPPRAARVYAISAIGVYDGFVACWDAKYAYWGIRPDQYDTTYKSLLPTPPFPGYPSGHAVVSAVTSELMTYLFPEDKTLWDKRAKDAAESRFHAGIHFRADNEIGLDLGRKVGKTIVEKVKNDGADTNSAFSAKKH